MEYLGKLKGWGKGSNPPAPAPSAIQLGLPFNTYPLAFNSSPPLNSPTQNVNSTVNTPYPLAFNSSPPLNSPTQNANSTVNENPIQIRLNSTVNSDIVNIGATANEESANAKSENEEYAHAKSEDSHPLISPPKYSTESFHRKKSEFAKRHQELLLAKKEIENADIVVDDPDLYWPLYHNISIFKNLEALHHLRREQVCRTIQSIYEESMNSEAVNVGSKAFLTSLNLITNMLWSTNSFDQASARGMEFKKLNGDLVYLLGVPNVSDLFPFLKALDLQGVNRRMMEVFRRFDGLFDSIIEEHLSGTNKHNNKGSQGKDFLEFLLDLKNGTHIDGESISITMKDVKVLLMDMLTGSTDTTANTVEWAMAELLKQPKIMKKAQKELEDVVGIEQRVEECHLTQLPYLEAIVKEVLRLHPALPLLAPHCPDKACQIGGFVIPKGTQVLVNVWAIQRDPTVWKEPLVFDPDRFVDSKWDYNGQELEYFPFGSGRRICAGLSLATRMVHYTLASLIHSFHWSLPSHHKLDMSEKYGIVLRKAVPLMAIPKPRLLRDDLYDFSV